MKELEETLRPLNIVAQRTAKGVSTSHEEHGNFLAKFQTIEIQTGSTMMDQFEPQYLGLANPFTMPVAVGGYDVPGKPRWRRPVTESGDLQGEAASRVPLEDPFFREQVQCVPPAVKLYDLARGMPRRIEAQYRRHWIFVPSLWIIVEFVFQRTIKPRYEFECNITRKARRLT